MKRWAYIIIFIHVTLFSQQAEIDSLENVLHLNDSVQKVDILNRLAFLYYSVSPERGIEYAETAHALAVDLDYKKGIATALQNIGVDLLGLGQFAESLRYQRDALEMFLQLDDAVGITESYIDIGIVYGEIGKIETALSNYLNGLKTAEEGGYRLGVAKLLNNIGGIYYDLGNDEKALDYWLRADSSYKALGRLDSRSSTLNNIGLIFLNQQDYDQALDYLNQAVELNLLIGDKKGLALEYMNIGGIKLDLGQREEALKYLNQSYQIAKEIKDVNIEAMILIDLGNFYLDLESYTTALSHYNRARQLGKQLKSNTLLMQSHSALAQIAAMQGEYKDAYEHHQLYETYKDSIYNERSSQQIAEMEIKYETEQKEKENQLLRSEKRIQEIQLNQQRTIIIIFIIFIVIAVAVTFLMIRDNVHRKKLNQMLRVSNAAKDRFFSIIAHDLRDPFSTILSFVRLLQRNVDRFSKEDVLKLTEELRNMTLSTMTLLENLLEWSRAQTGKLELKLVSHRLAAIVDQNISLIKQHAQDKNITIEMNVEKSLMVFSDKNMTGTVIRNLLSNAVKFTDHGGQVTISARVINGLTQISVTDTGIGISETVRDKLFSIDTKISTKGTDDERGSGLGLILCKELVEKQGGTIEVESKVGQGSTFRITLPNG